MFFSYDFAPASFIVVAPIDVKLVFIFLFRFILINVDSLRGV